MSRDKNPAYDAFAVRTVDGKDNWTRIGAAWYWPNREGINVVLTALPLTDHTNGKAKIVLKVWKPKEQNDAP